jgi:ubiquinone/menaquinone biosynthesis C-methylase UbiE
MGSDMTDAHMEYTGERMVPEKAETDTFWEHIYRYRFAANYVKGTDVLDIACGEGYGTASLVRAGARNVTGVDISAEACAHAHRKYGIDARQGSAENIPLEPNSVDVVVSFETIEHVSAPQEFIQECARVLRPGGTVVISTPNQAIYNVNTPNNPYHVSEMSEAEFVELFRGNFQNIEIYTQRPHVVTGFSLRALASEYANAQKLPGYWQIRKAAQKYLSNEVIDSESLEEARKDPVKAITRSASTLSSIANPYSIRKKHGDGERATYLIAVANRIG